MTVLEKNSNRELATSAETLSSLAMLKVHIDEGGDYLNYLRPYILYVIEKNLEDPITDSSISEGLRLYCGLMIPKRTVHIVLQRLSKDQYLSKISGVYIVQNILPNEDFISEKTSTLREIEFIAHELASFARLENDREISTQVATDSIIAFLAQFSIPCLKSFLRGTALPNFHNADNWRIVLVGQFLSKIQNNPKLFESFMKVAEGNMLANALLCPDLASVSKTYEKVTFFFDTPILIKLLALEGSEEEQVTRELINLIHKLNGKIRVFSHTIEELVNVIRVSSEYIDDTKGRGSIVEEARRSKRSKSDLILISEHAEQTLNELDILIYSTPAYTQNNHKFQISETAFSEILEEEIDYYNNKARDYDVKSVRSIYILRQNTKPRNIEKCTAVFVTSNTSFANAAYEFGREIQESEEVSTVITDFSLANTAWLKAPQESPDLPKKEVMAFAYAAMRPSRTFWGKVLVEAEKLEQNGEISPRDHQLLRSSHHVQTELMRLTLGEDSALNKTSIRKTLDRVSQEIRADDRKCIDKITEEKQETEGKLEKEQDRIKKIFDDAQKIAERRAKNEGRFLFILIWIAQFSISIFGIFVIFLAKDKILGITITAVGAVLAGSIRLAGAKWDIKPQKVEEKYITWRKTCLIKKYYPEFSKEQKNTSDIP